MLRISTLDIHRTILQTIILKTHLISNIFKIVVKKKKASNESQL